MLKSIPPTPANDSKLTMAKTPMERKHRLGRSATPHQAVRGGTQLDGTRQWLEGGSVLGTPSPTPCSPSRPSGTQLQEISSLAL